MHGKNAEIKGHPCKKYKYVFYCGCPSGWNGGNYIKRLTHKKERRTIKNQIKKIIGNIWNSNMECF